MDCCVLLCVSGEAEFSSHHGQAKQLSPSLCYFTAKKVELGAPSQTIANAEILVHYVKVVEGGNTSPESVECLLFTDGK